MKPRSEIGATDVARRPQPNHAVQRINDHRPSTVYPKVIFLIVLSRSFSPKAFYLSLVPIDLSLLLILSLFLTHELVTD
jgi:hypothetical protein